MKRTLSIAVVTLVVTVFVGSALAHDGEARGIRQLWRDAKTEVKQLFGMRSSGTDSGCPMMGGQSAMGGGMMSGSMMSGGMMGGGMMGGGTKGGGTTGGVPNDQWRDRGVPPPAGPRR